ncbi:MAG TPA: EscU/YscU/HrcU family type III secretion system export apparatus switch protein [Candidatus Binatia bacterium]|nr:EscU/YscU/HrcU family type III secretion system export apparatus switch protein [Candidatus Binatia bacterium]
MSDASEKPFDATPHRLAKARREGNVARSTELGANVSFAAALLAVCGAAPLLGTIAGRLLSEAASSGSPIPGSGALVAVALLPIAAAACGGALANAAQNGGFVVSPVVLKPERLNPIEGVRRILSRDTLNHSLRATLAFVCGAIAIVPILTSGASAFVGAATPMQGAAAAWTAARQVAAAAAGVGFCFSIAEYAAARSAWLRKLRMSLEERKRETKEEEGDAVARGRRRSLHRALLRTGLARVKDASFIVANPAHVAVALEYRPPDVPVPRILARALDDGAMLVRRLAERHGVPIIEDVLLARSLYRDARIGEAIPVAYYVALAEIVAALSRANEIRR